jgi:hypothetical protein
MNILQARERKPLKQKEVRAPMTIRIGYSGVISLSLGLVKDIGVYDNKDVLLVFYESEGDVCFREAKMMDTEESILKVRSYLVNDKRCKLVNSGYKRFYGRSWMLRQQTMDLVFKDGDPLDYKSKDGVTFLVEKIDFRDNVLHYKLGGIV